MIRNVSFSQNTYINRNKSQKPTFNGILIDPKLMERAWTKLRESGGTIKTGHIDITGLETSKGCRIFKTVIKPQDNSEYRQLEMNYVADRTYSGQYEVNTGTEVIPISEVPIIQKDSTPTGNILKWATRGCKIVLSNLFGQTPKHTVTETASQLSQILDWIAKG